MHICAYATVSSSLHILNISIVINYIKNIYILDWPRFCLKSFSRDFKELLVFFQNTAISFYLYICNSNEKIQVDLDTE